MYKYTNIHSYIYIYTYVYMCVLGGVRGAGIQKLRGDKRCGETKGALKVETVYYSWDGVFVLA